LYTGQDAGESLLTLLTVEEWGKANKDAGADAHAIWQPNILAVI